MLTENLLEDARSIAERITALRRAIHAEPELGLQTPKTLAKVRAELADLPLEWREGPSCTGAVAVLNRGKAGRSVLLRGDMDALPMEEETGLDFASTVSGRMHACGHDTHTAMLAGAARILAARADTLSGEVRFMFQPGEEGYHGARFMLDDGLLDPLPEAAFALHIMPNAPHGTIGSRVGRHARDFGRGQGRPRLDAARHARSRSRCVRDRPRASDDGHAPIQCPRG